MTTITEDYVSFETAKLLKEKGFPQNPYICNTAYTLRGKLSNNAKSFVHNFTEFNKCGIKPQTYSMAPTLQMAMKWLREEKKMGIEVDTNFGLDDDDKWYYEYGFCIFKLSSTFKKFAESDYNGYKTYEEACEAAIKYCLENLI